MLLRIKIRYGNNKIVKSCFLFFILVFCKKEFEFILVFGEMFLSYYLVLLVDIVIVISIMMGDVSIIKLVFRKLLDKLMYEKNNCVIKLW